MISKLKFANFYKLQFLNKFKFKNFIKSYNDHFLFLGSMKSFGALSMGSRYFFNTLGISTLPSSS